MVARCEETLAVHGSGEPVRTKLHRIAEKASREQGFKFTSLYHLMNKELLRGCFNRLRKDAAAGIDKMTKDMYAENLDANLSNLIDRLHRMAYIPQPVRRKYIPKPGSAKQRPLGIPCFEDKLVQAGLVRILESVYEQDFIEDSYGFRPSRNCHNALKALSETVENKPINHIVEADIKGFFDNVNQEWLMKFLAHRIGDKRIQRMVKRILKAGVAEDGSVTVSDEGTPQGGVISPVLSNLFLHYVFDKWMDRNYPRNPFCRYADDAVVHCRTEADALVLKEELDVRFRECGLELHPEKTKIVYCKDDLRRGDHPVTSFDFLGYTFRPRRSKSRNGKYFINFSPAVSNKAGKAMREKARRWKMHLRSDKSLEDLSRMFSPIIRGWINYYGRFYKSALYPTLRQLNRTLVRWATRKFKRLRRHRRRAEYWLGRIAKRQPWLFPHWQMGVKPTAG